MKDFSKVLTVMGVACVMAGSAAMAEEAQVQAYAHPTLFEDGSVQTTLTDEAQYVVGGKITKDSKNLSVKTKENVQINAFVKDVLNTIKVSTDRADFNVKMPVLRSELAVILSEGMSVNKSKASKYTDINSKYWAKSWIERALAANIMIGYPDNTFRPDQPVTKAEVFATIATLINVPTDRSLLVPSVDGKELRYIPRWSIPATKEVVASKLLAEIPDNDKLINNEYLTTEQVAYLVGALRQNYMFNEENAGKYVGKYKPTKINIKLLERISARTSNVGAKFYAATTSPVTLAGKTFPAGSLVKGEVVEVSRPGVKNAGFIKVEFDEIVNGSEKLELPKQMSEAAATLKKNPNVVARALGMPFTGAGRVVGVAGRSAAAAMNVAANGTEKIGAGLSNTFVNTLSGQPKAGARALGNSFVALGEGLYGVAKVAVSGTFGVLYEATDEIRYVIVPAYSNDSSLNAGEELSIIY